MSYLWMLLGWKFLKITACFGSFAVFVEFGGNFQEMSGFFNWAFSGFGCYNAIILSFLAWPLLVALGICPRSREACLFCLPVLPLCPP